MNPPAPAITQGNSGLVVSVADGRRFMAEDVILTKPSTVWSKIRITPPLPESLQPPMGTNLKYLAAVKRRFWKDGKLSPDSMTDGEVSMTWEGTDNQEGDKGASLHCFSGGPAAEKIRARPASTRDAYYAEELSKLYPGFKENFESSRFMDWPGDPWAQGGYSFPAPGNITSMGKTLHEGIGRLHFAGEHTCYKFVGYMEGGLYSGVAAARRLAQRDAVHAKMKKV